MVTAVVEISIVVPKKKKLLHNPETLLIYIQNNDDREAILILHIYVHRSIIHSIQRWKQSMCPSTD